MRYDIIYEKTIRDNLSGNVLNIEFESKADARLCCDLLNAKEEELKLKNSAIDEIAKWYEKKHGVSIIEERMKEYYSKNKVD